LGEGCGAAYLKISIGCLSTGQSLTDAVHEVFGLAAARDGADGLFLELDGHCDDRRGLWEDRVQEGSGRVRLRLDTPRRN
jgi:hypothetical protein